MSNDEVISLFNQTSLLIWEISMVVKCINAIMDAFIPYGGDAPINECSEIRNDKVCEPFTEKQCWFICKHILAEIYRDVADSELYKILTKAEVKLAKSKIFGRGLLTIPSDEINNINDEDDLWSYPCIKFYPKINI